MSQLHPHSRKLALPACRRVSVFIGNKRKRITEEAQKKITFVVFVKRPVFSLCVIFKAFTLHASKTLRHLLQKHPDCVFHIIKGSEGCSESPNFSFQLINKRFEWKYIKYDHTTSPCFSILKTFLNIFFALI